MHVINLFAGPGAGKSTTAALVFGNLKRRGVKAELVTEVAKDLTWENPGGRWQAFQLKLLADQAWRIERLRGHGITVAVTDSPVLLGMAYTDRHELDLLTPLALSEHRRGPSLNFFLNRTKPYSTVGRGQTEPEARMIDLRVRQVLDSLAVGYTIINDGPGVEDVIAEYAVEALSRG